MYCEKCNYQGKTGEYLCRNCGTALRSGAPRRPKVEFQARVIETVKQSIRSPLFVVPIVLYMFAMFLGFIADSDSEITWDILMYLNLGDGWRWGVSLINALPKLLIVIGLWILVAEASRSDGMGTAGLRFLVAAEVIGLLSYVWVPVSVLASMQYAADFEGSVWLVLLFILGLGVFIGVMKIRAISTVMDTVDTGMPNVEFSGFVGVILIIVGGLGILTMLGGFSLEKLLSSVAMLLFGIHFFVYKSNLQELEKESFYYDLGTGSGSFYKPNAFQKTGSSVKPTASKSIPTWKRIQMEEQKDEQQ